MGLHERLTAAGQVATTSLLLIAGGALAGTIHVAVEDREGMPVSDVVVYIELPDQANTTAPAGTTAIMDQYDQRFVPHILVVQTGTLVEFPNSDTVAHHVYSFSHPNAFKLPIYKGYAHPPVSFDESGVVVLGCNIHDHMLAYIAVVDSPVFAVTNTDGAVTLAADSVDAARVSIWSPRIRDKAEDLTVIFEDSEVDQSVVFRLQKSLRPPHEDQTEALTWSEY